MTTPLWSPGEFINPGDLRQPRSGNPVIPSQLDNNDLEGSGGWTFGDPLLSIVTDSRAYDGTKVIRHANTLFGTHAFTNDNVVPVVPGQVISAQCFYLRETNVSGRQGMTLTIQWFNAAMVFLGEADPGELNKGAVNIWYGAAVTGIAPEDAAFAQLLVRSRNNNTGGAHAQFFDQFSWNYVQPVAQAGLVYKAVQANAGFTAAIEPVWPLTLGLTVVDNEVTWEAVLASNVTWQAVPIMKSGTVEPVWPVEVGANIIDNTMNWLATDRRIQDVNCPNTKAVTIAASKIFAADRDIIRFSATINPKDWTTANDAGYLPFGLQAYGSNDVAALGLYRSNLVGFNSQGFQMWQVDQDPANMAFLDAVPIGCTYPHTIQPVANDLLMLTKVGARNISIAGASTNLQADGVGEPIDRPVREAIKALESDDDVIALYWPGMGQYWLIFGAEAFVLTINGAKKKSWSRYVFPSEITDWTLDGNTLVLRSGVKVWEVDEDLAFDDVNANAIVVVSGNSPQFPGAFGYSDAEVLAGSPFGTATPATLSGETISEIVYRSDSDEFIVSMLGELEQDFLLGLTVSDGDSGSITLDPADATFEANADYTTWQWPMPDPVFSDGNTYHVTLSAGGTGFEGIVQWPYLDMGAIGREKSLVGIDLVCDAPGGVSVSIGYNQNDRTQRTANYAVDADTLTGKLVPFPVSGPSFDLKLTFAAGQQWEWMAANLYVNDWRQGA